MFEKKLMIVENDRNIAELVERIALEAGFTCRISCNNATFIPTFEEMKPDVLVLDIFMPDMDGFEVLQFLHGRNSKIHIVILSGDHYYRELAAKLGDNLGLCVDIVVSKPFRVNELRMILQEIMFSLNPSSSHPTLVKKDGNA